MSDEFEDFLRRELKTEAENAPSHHEFARGVLQRHARRVAVWRALAAGALACLGVSVLAATAALQPRGAWAPVQVTPQGPVGPVDISPFADCLPPSSDRDVVDQQFALDGSVLSMRVVATESMPMADVTVHVNDWFKGSGRPEVTARMAAPPELAAGYVGGESLPRYSVGTRLLLAGREEQTGEIFPAGCGYSHYFDVKTAQEWSRLFTG